MVHKERKFFISLALMILGILIAVQSKSIIEHNKQNKSVQKEIAEYTEQLNVENNKEKSLKKELSDFEKKKEEMIEELSKNDSDSRLRDLKKTVDYDKMLAGLTDVKGQGITIQLEDALPKMVENQNSLLIHDTDILKIINELKSAGAEAISVNNERIVATSELVCAGPTILVNNNRYTPPYIIRAIGDPDKMYQMVDESQRVYLMRNDGIRISIEKTKNITIPKYSYNIDELLTGLEVN